MHISKFKRQKENIEGYVENMYFYLLSYPIIGAGIKYMDATFDDKTVSKKIAIFIGK